MTPSDNLFRATSAMVKTLSCRLTHLIKSKLVHPYPNVSTGKNTREQLDKKKKKTKRR